MRIRTFLVIALLSVPLFAAQAKIYPAYETARQALLSASIPQIQLSAKQLAIAARAEKQDAIAAKADALSAAKDVPSARSAFAALSDEVIRFRASSAGGRPVVAWCSMEKKSWLQPAGTPISNPFLDGGMRTCGQFVKDASH